MDTYNVEARFDPRRILKEVRQRDVCYERPVEARFDPRRILKAVLPAASVPAYILERGSVPRGY